MTSRYAYKSNETILRTGYIALHSNGALILAYSPFESGGPGMARSHGVHALANAREALTRAVSINPDLATAHNALGVAYARTGDANRAVEEWRRALALQPDFADARANLERVGAR